MQEENQNFSEFFLRTDMLAEKLGVRAIDLPEIIGLSKAMLFAYRKGKYPISWRAWRKLEAAERAAGLVRDDPTPCGRAGPPDTLREDPLDGLSPEVRTAVEAIAQILRNEISPLVTRLEALEAMLARLKK